jgi:hypothetical protein
MDSSVNIGIQLLTEDDWTKWCSAVNRQPKGWYQCTFQEPRSISIELTASGLREEEGYDRDFFINNEAEVLVVMSNHLPLSGILEGPTFQSRNFKHWLLVGFTEDNLTKIHTALASQDLLELTLVLKPLINK